MSQPVRPVRRVTDQCTHGQVTRIWDKYGCFKCSLCRKPSDFLFRCTQDTDGNLPDSDFIDVEDELRDFEISSHHSTDSCDSATANSLVPSFPTAPTLSTNASLKSVTPRSSSPNGPCNNTANLRYRFGAPDPEAPRRLFVTNPEPVAPCDYMVCSNCRPIYRDRAWQSIDKIVNDTVAPPSQFEMENRPISNAEVLSNMDYTGQRFYATLQENAVGESRDRFTDASSSTTRLNELFGNLNTHNKDLEEKIQGEYALKKKDYIMKQEGKSSTPSVQTSDYDADNEQLDTGNISDSADVDFDPDYVHPLDKSKRPSFLRNMIYNASARLICPTTAQDNLSGTNTNGGSRDTPATTSTSTSDKEDKEKRMGRRLTKGRFFID